jgi:hypothetical protein
MMWRATPKGLAYVASRKDYQRWFHLSRTYNISREEFDRILERQEGKCGICRREMKRIYVDHDHATGLARGFLCPACNTILGLALDQKDRLQAAIDYLDRFTPDLIPDSPPSGPFAER